jgi:hypothetical protein
MALQNDLIVEASELEVDAARMSDTLDNLTHMVCWNDKDAGLVWMYAQQLEARVRTLGTLLRSADPNMREVRARLCN